MVALAGGLAKVQQQFLNAAMKNMDTMKENGSAAVSGGEGQDDKEAQEKQRNAFLEAQSEYQANM